MQSPCVTRDASWGFWGCSCSHRAICGLAAPCGISVYRISLHGSDFNPNGVATKPCLLLFVGSEWGAWSCGELAPHPGSKRDHSMDPVFMSGVRRGPQRGPGATEGQLNNLFGLLRSACWDNLPATSWEENPGSQQAVAMSRVLAPVLGRLPGSWDTC